MEDRKHNRLNHDSKSARHFKKKNSYESSKIRFEIKETFFVPFLSFVNTRFTFLSLIQSNSPSVSPSYSQGEFSASRSPSPMEHRTNQQYSRNRINSRSPSPILQFRPNNSNLSSNKSLNTKHLASDPGAQAQQLRKLPPIPLTHKLTKPIQQTSFRQISEESGDFEMSNIPTNPCQRPQPQQKTIIGQINNGNRTKPNQYNQAQIRTHNTIVTMNDTIKLSKQYASIGDDDSDENENWF